MKGRLPHVDGDPALNSFRGSRPFDVRNVGFHKSSATFFHLAYERSKNNEEWHRTTVGFHRWSDLMIILASDGSVRSVVRGVETIDLPKAVFVRRTVGPGPGLQYSYPLSPFPLFRKEPC